MRLDGGECHQTTALLMKIYQSRYVDIAYAVAIGEHERLHHRHISRYA